MTLSLPRPRFSPLVLAFALVLPQAGSAIGLLRAPALTRPVAPLDRSVLGDRLHDDSVPVAIEPTPSPDPAPVADVQIASAPVSAIGRLVIPTIGVTAPIYTVGLDSSGAVAVVSGLWDVGWYRGSAAIGSPGTALIEGHLDWYTGRAVFWDLHRLGAGDSVMFRQPSGNVLTYRVSELRYVTYYTPLTVDLLAMSGPSRIAMVTCAGTWLTGAHTYSQRLIVVANLVG